MNELKTLTLQQKYDVISCVSNSHMRYTKKKAVNYMLLGYLGFDINQPDVKEYLNLNEITIDYTNFDEMNNKWYFVNDYNCLFTIIAALKEDNNNQEAYETFYNYCKRMVRYFAVIQHLSISDSMSVNAEDIAMECIFRMIRSKFIERCSFINPYGLYFCLRLIITGCIKDSGMEINMIYIPRNRHRDYNRIYKYIKEKYPELIRIKDGFVYESNLTEEIKNEILFNLNITEETLDLYIENQIENTEIHKNMENTYQNLQDILFYMTDDGDGRIKDGQTTKDIDKTEIADINNSLLKILTPIEQFAVESYYYNDNRYSQIVEDLNSKFLTDKYNYQNVQKMIKRAILKMRKQAKTLYPDMNIDELISA